MSRQNRVAAWPGLRSIGLSPEQDAGREWRPGVSERWLRSITGAAYWFAMTVVILGNSFVPDLAPENAGLWRALLAGTSLGLCLINLWLIPRAKSNRYQVWTELNIIPALGLNLVMLQLTAATELVLLNVIVALIYAGFFYRIPALIASTAAAFVVGASAFFTDPASGAPYLASFMTIYLPTLLLTPLLIHLHNRETLNALDDARLRALTDPLTGLANLRALEDAVEHELAERGSDRPDVLGLLLIDLDNFKSANTKYGHAGGDHALREVARQMRRVAPRNALVARVGGDEFAVLVRGRSRQHVTTIGELICSAPRAASAVMNLPGVAIDAALGVAIHPEDGRNLDELLDSADRSIDLNKGEKRHPVPDLEAIPSAERRPRPAWLNVAKDPIKRERGRFETLDSVMGGHTKLLGGRSLYARASALAWVLATTMLMASLLMPEISSEAVLPWWILPCVGAGMAAGALILNVEPDQVSHTVTDIAVLAAMALAIYLTGGFASPAGLLLILMVASQAWFWQTRKLALRVIGPAVVALSPLAYQSVDQAPQGMISVATAVGLAALLITLVLAMRYDSLLLSALERRAEKFALIDPLTEIPNRRAFDMRVQELLDQEPAQPFAIVMLDLDNFRRVNVEHGHRTGDQVLRAVAQALADATRSGDQLTRVGGDEFALILPGVQVDAARSLAERCIATVGATPEAACHDIGASAGFALYPLHGETLDDLVFTADSALLAVKASGRGSARVARIVSAVG
jgi:diguanylate cyclase (GGDEF)-like protein